jgi:hypothetical protein
VRCLVHRIVLKDLPVVENLDASSLKQVVGGAFDAFHPGQSSSLFMKLTSFAPANDPSFQGGVKVGSWSWSQGGVKVGSWSWRGDDCPTERQV